VGGGGLGLGDYGCLFLLTEHARPKSEGKGPKFKVQKPDYKKRASLLKVLLYPPATQEAVTEPVLERRRFRKRGEPESEKGNRGSLPGTISIKEKVSGLKYRRKRFNPGKEEKEVFR